MKYFLFIIPFLLISCSDGNLDNIDVPLEGKWVDVSSPTNVMTFKLVAGKKAMILERGKEMRDGHLLPKMGSGQYDYDVLSAEVLALRSNFSSNSNFHEYYFERTGDILKVEKFFEPDDTGTIVTFRKAD